MTTAMKCKPSDPCTQVYGEHEHVDGVDGKDLLREPFNPGPHTRSINELNDITHTRTEMPRTDLSLLEGKTLTASYKKQQFKALVQGGSVVYDGHTYTSLSAAGKAVTGCSTNGQKFWSAA